MNTIIIIISYVILHHGSRRKFLRERQEDTPHTSRLSEIVVEEIPLEFERSRRYGF